MVGAGDAALTSTGQVFRVALSHGLSVWAEPVHHHLGDTGRRLATVRAGEGDLVDVEQTRIEAQNSHSTVSSDMVVTLLAIAANGFSGVAAILHFKPVLPGMVEAGVPEC
jgi:hypothetical protein